MLRMAAARTDFEHIADCIGFERTADCIADLVADHTVVLGVDCIAAADCTVVHRHLDRS